MQKSPGRHRILTQDQINEARTLREKFGLTKREIAGVFNVGATTIWDNIYSINGHKTRKEKRELHKITLRTIKIKCMPCVVCGICLKEAIEDHRIPLAYRVGEKCVVCYLREKGLEYMDLYKDYE